MNVQDQGKITWKQAVYLALIVLCVYYPIILYVNIPIERWRHVDLVSLHPTIVIFTFYTILILAIDRIIDFAGRWVGPRILQLEIRTVALSVLVAGMAVVLSQVIFKVNYELWSWLVEPERQEQVRDLGRRPPSPPPIWNSLRRTNNGLTVIISISIFYLILNRKSYFRMKAMEVQAEQLRKETALAQIEALKNQVSPHFLFNSLSILSSLVHVDARLSEQFIDRLSRAYRYLLEQKDNDLVLLKTELDFLESYAFLLKIRFEKKFDVKSEVTPGDAARYRIAPLTLQLLIENAVKHNRMSEVEPLVVSVAIRDGYLEVSNPIRPRDEGSVTSTGIGLSNIQGRYRMLTDKPVEVLDNHDVFIVKIPLL